MKVFTKVTAFVLVLLMLVSITACNKDTGSDVQSSDADTTDTVAVTDETNKEYDGVFKVGFGRVDITPKIPCVLSSSEKFTTVKDSVYATCVAINDGKNTALIVTLDIKNQSEGFCDKVRARIKSVTGVVGKNVMISATHNHSAPQATESTSNSDVSRWSAGLITQITNACKEAIDDLSDAEIYIGTGKTTGMAFVRRYFHEDGSFSGIHTASSSSKIVRYETEADDTVQIIRFARADKKDVVMANWQCHVASAASLAGTVTSDLVHYVRQGVEEGDTDTLFAYYQGASGNINTQAKVSGTGVCSSYVDVGKRLGKIILEQFKNLTKVQAGEIQATRTNYKVNARKPDEETIKHAQEAIDSKYASAIMKKYGFEHQKDADRVIWRSKLDDKLDIYIGAISFGDIGIASVPYEMFDTSGMQVKEGSPFKMTFMLTCTGGGIYVPTKESIPNGGYEVYMASHEYGTAEKVVEKLVSMLSEQKEKQS